MSEKHWASKNTGYFLTFSNIISYGFLSMTGMLLITSSLPIAVAAFFLGSLVEGDVNKVNIMRGIKKSINKDYLLLALTKQEIAKVLMSEENELSPFFKLYKDQLHYYKKLKKIHGCNPEARKELHEAKQHLIFMRRYLSEKILSDSDNSNSDLFLGDLKKFIDSEAFKSTFKYKIIGIRISWGISTLSGIGTGFISAFATQSSLTSFLYVFGITATSTAMAATVIPLAITAGIAYLYISYNNIHEMITDDLLQHYWKNTKIFFTTVDHDHLYRDVGKKILFALFAFSILSIGLFVTAATAGTWWHGIKHGAKFVHFLKNFSNLIRYITVPCVTLSALLFNLKNSLQTIQEALKTNTENKKEENEKNGILEKIKELVSNIFLDAFMTLLIKRYLEETILEFLNPFRFIKFVLEIPLQILIFIGHLIAIGAMTDRIGKIDPTAVAVMGAVAEGAEDSHYFLPKETAHHGHNHGGFLRGFVKILFVISGLALLDALWRFTFSKKTALESLRAALNHHSHGHQKSNESLKKPLMSNEWKKEEALMKIEDERLRYQRSYGEIAKSKATAIKKLYEEIKQSHLLPEENSNQKETNFSSLIDSKKFNEIKKNRSAFFHQPRTKGEEFLTSLQEKYGDLKFSTSCAA